MDALRERCKELNINFSGPKAVLLARLEGFNAAHRIQCKRSFLESKSDFLKSLIDGQTTVELPTANTRTIQLLVMAMACGDSSSMLLELSWRELVDLVLLADVLDVAEVAEAVAAFMVKRDRGKKNSAGVFCAFVCLCA